MIKAEIKTAVVSAGKLEEHPESFRPRVFVKIDNGDDIVFYELLQDGYAIPWPKAPTGHPNGGMFDFWLVKAANLSDVNMVRA